MVAVLAEQSLQATEWLSSREVEYKVKRRGSLALTKRKEAKLIPVQEAVI